MKHEIDLPDLPDGFEYTGEWRQASEREQYLSEDSSDLIAINDYADRTSYKYHILRKTAPASLLDRIKAEYAEYDVVELEWDKRDLWTMKGHGCYDSAYLHTTAQSMKGFGWYVYDDDGLFLRLEAVIDNHDEALHPCAVLFTK